MKMVVTLLKNSRLGTVATVTLLCLYQSANALPFPQETIDVPIERLALNLKSQIGQRPGNPSGYYALGRLYSLAYALGRDSFDALVPKDGSEPSIVADYFEGVLPLSSTSPLEMDKRKTYLSESLRYYTIAYRLSDWSIYALAYGWSCQEAAKYPCEIPIPLPTMTLTDAEQKAIKNAIGNLARADEKRRGVAIELLRNTGPAAATIYNDACIAPETCSAPAFKEVVSFVWNQMALEAYRHVYPIQRESAYKYRSFDVITYEIGSGIVEILEGRERLPRKEKRELEEIKHDLEEIGTFSRTVSPIIFSLSENHNIDELICGSARAKFDFMGLGNDDVWPWVHPSTAILVWDPFNVGNVLSGRQLIGSVTWWIFWRDGFAVLQALDDNSDGWLRGDELDGLAVWRDSDSDAQSDPGEVVPVAQCGIYALATCHSGSGVDYLVNPNGLILENGNTLPLYDWWPVSESGVPTSVR